MSSVGPPTAANANSAGERRPGDARAGGSAASRAARLSGEAREREHDRDVAGGRRQPADVGGESARRDQQRESHRWHELRRGATRPEPAHEQTTAGAEDEQHQGEQDAPQMNAPVKRGIYSDSGGHDAARVQAARVGVEAILSGDAHRRGCAARGDRSRLAGGRAELERAGGHAVCLESLTRVAHPDLGDRMCRQWLHRRIRAGRARALSEVELIEAGANLGYAGGNNLGLLVRARARRTSGSCS